MNETISKGPFCFARARVYIYAFFALGIALPVAGAEFKSVAEAATALSSAAPKDRADAARHLARERAVDRIPDLAARLSIETDKTVRQGLAVALANLGLPALSQLQTALTDRQAEVRLEAAGGLGRIGTPAAAASLLARLEAEPEAGVRHTILFWLGELKNTASVPALDRALGDGDPNLRAQAARSLGAIGTPAAKAAAGKAAKDTDPKVRKVAERASR